MIKKRKGKGKGYDSDYLAAYYIYDKREARVFLIQRHTSAPKLAGERKRKLSLPVDKCISTPMDQAQKIISKNHWRVSYTLNPLSFSSLLAPSVPWSSIGRNMKREEENSPCVLNEINEDRKGQYSHGRKG